MSPVVFWTLAGLFAPPLIAAITAYAFNKFDSALALIIGAVAMVATIATFASWTAGNWTIYEENGGGVIWLPIAIVWAVVSFFSFIGIDSLMQN